MCRGLRSTGRHGEFDRLILESLDESLASVLGEIVRKAVYDALENNYSIARHRIPEKLDDFASALDKAFGVAASKTIGKVIVKRLYFKLGLEFVETANWRLPDYVREARAMTIGRSELVEPR